MKIRSNFVSNSSSSNYIVSSPHSKLRCSYEFEIDLDEYDSATTLQELEELCEEYDIICTDEMKEAIENNKSVYFLHFSNEIDDTPDDLIIYKNGLKYCTRDNYEITILDSDN